MRTVHHALSTGALRERDDTQKAYAALGDPDRVTIVQIAPAVRAAWGEASACRPARQPSVSWCPFCASWAQIMCSTPRFPPI